jgi:hypothetical protein
MLNDPNENNPNARKVIEPIGSDRHEITLAELKKANVKGAQNPASVSRHTGGGDIMSGEEDRAGVPMTKAAADATRANDLILGKHEQEAGSRVMVHTENGKSFAHPPNTPLI